MIRRILSIYRRRGAGYDGTHRRPGYEASLARLWRNTTVRRQALFLISFCSIDNSGLDLQPCIKQTLKRAWLVQQTAWSGGCRRPILKQRSVGLSHVTAPNLVLSRRWKRGRQLMDVTADPPSLRAWLPLLADTKPHFLTLLAGTVVIIGIIG